MSARLWVWVGARQVRPVLLELAFLPPRLRAQACPPPPPDLIQPLVGATTLTAPAFFKNKKRKKTGFCVGSATLVAVISELHFVELTPGDATKKKILAPCRYASSSRRVCGAAPHMEFALRFRRHARVRGFTARAWSSP